jgi:hypothetical protein
LLAGWGSCGCMWSRAAPGISTSSTLHLKRCMDAAGRSDLAAGHVQPQASFMSCLEAANAPAPQVLFVFFCASVHGLAASLCQARRRWRLFGRLAPARPWCLWLPSVAPAAFSGAPWLPSVAPHVMISPPAPRPPPPQTSSDTLASQHDREHVAAFGGAGCLQWRPQAAFSGALVPLVSLVPPAHRPAHRPSPSL